MSAIRPADGGRPVAARAEPRGFALHGEPDPSDSGHAHSGDVVPGRDRPGAASSPDGSRSVRRLTLPVVGEASPPRVAAPGPVPS